MKIEVDAKLVVIYVNSTDQWHGKPLYTAIVQLCQEKGIAGATVFRCMEGYGASRQLHTSRLLELSENMPVRLEIIDIPERIGPLLTALEEMIGEGMVTISDVHILRFLADPAPDAYDRRARAARMAAPVTPPSGPQTAGRPSSRSDSAPTPGAALPGASSGGTGAS